MNIHSSSLYQPSLPPTYLTSASSAARKAPENVGSVLKPAEPPQSPRRNQLAVQAQPTAARVSLASEGLNAKQAQLEAQQEHIEQQKIDKLADRDREVRNHERAHAAVGGQFAGAPRYQYERGPNGVNYAISGEVSISVSPVSGDLQATIAKAQTVRRAALAPAEPSAQDRNVAAQATKMEAQARVELVALKHEEHLAESRVEGRAEARTLEEPVEQQAENNAPANSSDGAQNTYSSYGSSDAPSPKPPDETPPFNRLSKQLEQRLLSSNPESQSISSGSIVSRYV